MQSSLHPLVCLVGAVVAFSGLPAHAQTAAPVPHVAPSGKVWSAGDGFQFADKEKKTRRSVSGIACARNAAQVPVCLVVFDEGMEARFAELGAGKLLPRAPGVRFGVAGKELDAEGAATDGRFFYVTGSHAVKRGNCAPNAASQHVLRFLRDPVTGLAAQAADGADGAVTPAGYQESRRLLKLIGADFHLRGSLAAGRCLGTGALDIEALAVRDGRLHFGLRGPTEGGHAFIASVDADAFFAGTAAGLAVTRVPVGERRGLRDMAVVRDGILLLAGPDDNAYSSEAGWAVSLWNDRQDAGKRAEPKPLATLDLSKIALGKCDQETKPEAMTVLQESERGFQLLVLSDGMCDGGAMVFDIAR